MSKTAVYVRVSTAKQDTSRQVQEIEDYLGDQEHEIFSDVASGMKDDRKGLQKMLEKVREGEIDRIVAHEFSRITRRMSFGAEIIELCTEHGVELETINDMFPGVKSGNDVFEKMMNQFAAWMVNFQREMIRERVQSGVNKAMREGKWVGRPPYGFSTNDNGHLEIEPENYLAMQQAVERALTTEDSVNSIAETLGVPQSSLHRILEEEEKKELYLYGENSDERLAKAVEEAEISPEAEISKLEERVSKLEDEIGEEA